MLENQIYTIEAANINQETLNALKNAGKAMKDIHGNMDINKVDNIMYVKIFRCLFYPIPLSISPSHRTEPFRISSLISYRCILHPPPYTVSQSLVSTH
jgi:Snf7